MNPSLDELTRALAQLRQEQTADQETLDKLLETDIGQAIISIQQCMRFRLGLMAAAQEKLAAAMVAAYSETGIQKYGSGSVDMVTVLCYSRREAIEWCAKSNRLEFLMLDTGNFERYARSADLDFVSSCFEPRATILPDLSQFLPKSEPRLQPGEPQGEKENG